MLPRVLALTFFASIGAAVTWNGVYYVAHDLFAYGPRGNLLLGAVLGLAYALAAWFASDATEAARSITARVFGRPISARGRLASILVLSAAASLIPVFVPSEAGMWIFGLISVPLLGFFWPSVETYVSSGQRGADLNRATGYWNVCWAFALLPGMWALAPLLKSDPRSVIPAVAPLTLIALIPLFMLPREPGSHGEAAHEHSPEQDALYRKLLRRFRICLIGSYLLNSALAAVMPVIMTRLAVPTEWRTPLQSTWMFSRLAIFITLMVWRGWHGKQGLSFIAGGLMIAGFGVAFTAGAWPVLAGGLAVLGIGLGLTYAAAIYYALEVGSTDVDAGGRHEAAIGLGYTLGPLVVLGAIEAGLVSL